MAKNILSTKRLQIDKANANMVVILAVAAFLTVFSLVASRALVSQRGYQGRVIEKKKKALTQLKANNEAAKKLVTSYTAFISTPDNIIGGLPSGTGDRDGDNAKIVLDALPSKYDFPALVSSIEKVLISRNYIINSISGTDDEINQSSSTTPNSTASASENGQTTETSSASATGQSIQPVEMPFEVTVAGNLDSAQGLLDVFQLSIRPIRVFKFSLSGADDKLNIEVSAKSYYQPQKKVTIKLEAVQ